MASTNKLEALAQAEKLLSAAGVDRDTVGAIVTVLSDDAPVETVNFTTAGDGALATPKALVTGTGMNAGAKNVEQLNQEIARLDAMVPKALAAWLSTKGPQQRAVLKNVWQQLMKIKEGRFAEREQVYTSLMSSGNAEPERQINSLGAAIIHLDGLGFAQPVEHRSKEGRAKAFILGRDVAGAAMLDLVLQTISAAGTVDRKEGRLLTLEGGSGVGKSYAAMLIDVLLERAARARAGDQPAGEALQQLLTAFHEERVAVLYFEFNTMGDHISGKDVMPCTNPNVALGIRLAARGLFSVSTEALREELRRLPEGVESLFTVEDVFPLVCRRLRTAHGLAADPSADARPLILICSFDEFQLIARDLHKGFSCTKAAARTFCQEFQQCLAQLVLAADGGNASMAAKHGVYLVPVLAGVSLYGLEDDKVSRLAWSRCYLQPLSCHDSCLLFKRKVLQYVKWPASREAFFDRLAATPHVETTVKMMGGNPALLMEAATTFVLDLDLCRSIQNVMRDNNLSAPHLASFTALWLSKCMERLWVRYRFEVILERLCGGDCQHLPQLARKLLLLLLTGTTINEETCICEASAATLGDALVSGVFHVRAESTELVISMPAILLMMLKRTEDALEACSEAECLAINQLIPDNVMAQQDTTGAVSEPIAGAQRVLRAACQKEMGLFASPSHHGCTAAAQKGPEAAESRAVW